LPRADQQGMMGALMAVSEKKSEAAGSEPGQSTLTHRAASGFFWMLGQTVGSKIFGFATQIVLARLLAPRDFGLVALAYAAVAFVAMIRNTGIQQILVQRHKHFRRWVNPAFWFEFSVGLATAAMLVVAAPVAAAVFHSRPLIGLILVIAAAAPLSPWYVVPSAKLTMEMRFRAIAAVNIGYNLIAMVVSILLAWRGFGAYSFVIPLPVAGVVRAVWLWRLARPPIRFRPQMRRWKFLIGDSGYTLGTGFIFSILAQAGSMALGLFYAKAVVGQYFFAFNLSTQIWQLLSQNLGNVLLPALAKLQDDRPRQVAALLRASRMLAFVGVPMSLLLAVVAKPLILIVYGAKWLPAVPVLQVLAISMAVSLPGSLAYTALQSQGRFRAVFIFTALQLPAFLAAAVVGAGLGGAMGVSVGWLLANLIFSPLWIKIAGGREVSWRRVAAVYAGPFVASAAALAPAAILILWWQTLATRYLLQGLLAAASLAAIYPASSAALCREEFSSFLQQARRLARKFFSGESDG
jgi:O-antigen/teichoic acid export membrane protein